MVNIDSFTKPSRVAVVAVSGAIALLVFLQMGFLILERFEARRAFDGVKAILRNEEFGSNPFLISREILDLSERGIIHCPNLSDMQNRNFLPSSNRENCRPFPLFIGEVSLSETFTSINGLSWTLSAVVPASFALNLSVWLVRMLGLSLWFIGVFYVQSLKKLVHKERELSTLVLNQADALERLHKQVAHDIRSPLSALKMVLGKSSGLSEERTQLAERAIIRINDIADDVLRRGSSKLSNAERDVIGLPEVIESIIAEKRAILDGRGVKIESSIEAIDCKVVASAKEVSRILSNLIENGIEALDEKPGRVMVSLKETEQNFLLSVSDNGKGIPPEHLAKIGTRGVSFGKVGSASGNGIGLAHAKEYIESIGGEFTIASQMGKGTTILMCLRK